MLTKEEYQREYIRMMDSMRDGFYKGIAGCDGVACVTEERECPLRRMCSSSMSVKAFDIFDIIEAVEKWSKEHPIVTYLDKLIEAYGINIKSSDMLPCPNAMCLVTDEHCCHSKNKTCGECKREFWNSEYKPPVKEM